MNILLTGGLCFIASHTATVLTAQDHQAVLLDNLYNSQIESLASLEKIVGYSPPFYWGNVRDGGLIREILSIQHIDIVMYLSGLKLVVESTTNPFLHFDNNVGGSIALLQAMQVPGVKKLILVQTQPSKLCRNIYRTMRRTPQPRATSMAARNCRPRHC